MLEAATIIFVCAAVPLGGAVAVLGIRHHGVAVIPVSIRRLLHNSALHSADRGISLQPDTEFVVYAYRAAVAFLKIAADLWLMLCVPVYFVCLVISFWTQQIGLYVAQHLFGTNAYMLLQQWSGHG